MDGTWLVRHASGSARVKARASNEVQALELTLRASSSERRASSGVWESSNLTPCLRPPPHLKRTAGPELTRGIEEREARLKEFGAHVRAAAIRAAGGKRVRACAGRCVL